MNETSVGNKFEIQFSNLNSRQLATLKLFNLIIMAGNVSLNIKILSKTKQIANITFIIIFFMLSTLVQNLSIC